MSAVHREWLHSQATEQAQAASPAPAPAPQPAGRFAARGLRAAPTRVSAPTVAGGTRRYPRTLEQAFPASEGYRQAVHGPYQRGRLRHALGWALVALLALALAGVQP